MRCHRLLLRSCAGGHTRSLVLSSPFRAAELQPALRASASTNHRLSSICDYRVPTHISHNSSSHGSSCQCRRGVSCGGAAPAAVEALTSQQVEFEPVIGIETHVQLLTRTKAFCNCPSEFGAEPNTNICPVCMGHPGTLPVMNAEAVKLGVLAGLALDCNIASRSKFDRKQYFYADLPKGYQISQYDEPLCSNGSLEVEMAGGEKKRFGITRAHLEEDAGKFVYSGSAALSGAEYGLVDYNRAGVPLLEIVSEPDMRSGKDAYAYGCELRRIVRFLGISDGNMAEGSMRCDVNVSVRPKGQEKFGTKVEVKNMNSFSNVQKAIEFEIERQVALIRAGKGDEIVTETRLWDEFKLATTSMRKKEGLADYRFFPEPDLPPVRIPDDMRDELKRTMAELPAQKRARYKALGLPAADVIILADDLGTTQLFDAVLGAGVTTKTASNWFLGDIMAYCKETKQGMEDLKVAPAALAEMIKLIEDGVISGAIAKQILADILQGSANDGVRKFVEGKGLLMIDDDGAIDEFVGRVLAAHPTQLAEYRGGKVKLQGFFEGQLMKESKGRVNPGKMKAALLKRLKEDA